MENQYNKHYIRLDENQNIIAGISNAFEDYYPILPTDICINEQGGSHFRLIIDGEPTEENPMLRDEYGRWLYSYDETQGEAVVNQYADVIPLEVLKSAKLAENSAVCKDILINGFKSSVHGDGLQPYRMNNDDQTNLAGLQGIITLGLLNQAELPLFSWKNALQVQCEQTWTYGQIINLVAEYGAWKTAVLARQDVIKESLLNAQTAGEIEAVGIDYSDLLNFAG